MLILELLEFVDDVVEIEGSRDINYVHQILKNGTGAAKQLAVLKRLMILQKLLTL
jgi:carboxylate-amine ligase